MPGRNIDTVMPILSCYYIDFRTFISMDPLLLVFSFDHARLKQEITDSADRLPMIEAEMVDINEKIIKYNFFELNAMCFL